MIISTNGSEFISNHDDQDLAEEVKCFLLTAQNSKKSCSLVKMLTTRSQGSNDNCPEYNQLLLDTLSNHPKLKLLSVSFDGLSNEAKCIRKKLLIFF